MLHIRKPYEPLKDENIRRPVVTINKEPSMTKQSFAKELDVNRIIQKYNRTGVLQKATDFEGVYGEFNSYDLREAIEKVDKATEIFMEVPSDIRGQFENDAGAFIDYVTNPENIKQVRDWGLAKAEPPPTEPVSEPPATPPATPPVEPPATPPAT